MVTANDIRGLNPPVEVQSTVYFQTTDKILQSSGQLNNIARNDKNPCSFDGTSKFKFTLRDDGGDSYTKFRKLIENESYNEYLMNVLWTLEGLGYVYLHRVQLVFFEAEISETLHIYVEFYGQFEEQMSSVHFLRFKINLPPWSHLLVGSTKDLNLTKPCEKTFKNMEELLNSKLSNEEYSYLAEYDKLENYHG